MVMNGMPQKKIQRMNNITPVILCGDSVTRPWPLSRQHLPKQFLNLAGETTRFRTYWKFNFLKKLPKSQPYLSSLRRWVKKVLVITANLFIVISR